MDKRGNDTGRRRASRSKYIGKTNMSLPEEELELIKDTVYRTGRNYELFDHVYGKSDMASVLHNVATSHLALLEYCREVEQKVTRANIFTGILITRGAANDD